VSQDTRIGTEIAGYHIDSLIGRGGMSVVYLAHHTGLERKAALKLLAPELAENEAFRARFVRESRIAAGLDHPNVIPVYEAGEADGLLYIAMRYVRGSDLRTLLAEHGPLDVADVVRVVDQVADALVAAHSEGLVHRDVKPGNVLMSPATPPARVGHLYLADFGLTKKSLSGSGLTRSGQFVGTTDYVAPEQIRAEPVDGRADVYSLGCVLYECLTGEPPFVRDVEVAVMFAQLNDAPPRPTDARPELPEAIDAVVAKAMAKTPGARYQGPGDLAEAVHRALRVDPERVAPAPLAVPARRRRGLLVGAVSGLAVIALLVGLLVANRGPSHPGTLPSTGASASGSPKGPSILTGFKGVVEIDPSTGRVGTTSPLDLGVNIFDVQIGRPLVAAEGAVWVAVTTPAMELVKLDSATGAPERPIVLSSQRPSSISLAARNGAVWALPNGTHQSNPPTDLVRIDPATDRVVGRIHTGVGVGVADGPEGVWVVGSGRLSEIDTSRNEIARRIPVDAHASGIALAAGAVWLSDYLDGVVYRVDPATERQRAIPLPGSVDSIAADSSGVWILDRKSGSVARIDPASGTLGSPIRVGANPSNLALGGGSVWVADPDEGTVWRVDEVTGVATSFPVAEDPGPGWVSFGEGGVWASMEGLVH
jgi:serine/threonine protein kinase/sugar lactone lactonase YvrE